MESSAGRATYRRGKLYFNAVGWAMVREVAKYTHKTPTAVVVAALKRYIRARAHEKTKVS